MKFFYGLCFFFILNCPLYANQKVENIYLGSGAELVQVIHKMAPALLVKYKSNPFTKLFDTEKKFDLKIVEGIRLGMLKKELFSELNYQDRYSGSTQGIAYSFAIMSKGKRLYENGYCIDFVFDENDVLTEFSYYSDDQMYFVTEQRPSKNELRPKLVLFKDTKQLAQAIRENYKKTFDANLDYDLDEKGFRKPKVEVSTSKRMYLEEIEEDRKHLQSLADDPLSVALNKRTSLKNLEAVSLGMSRKEIIQKLGSPNNDRDLGDSFTYVMIVDQGMIIAMMNESGFRLEFTLKNGKLVEIRGNEVWRETWLVQANEVN